MIFCDRCRSKLPCYQEHRYEFRVTLRAQAPHFSIGAHLCPRCLETVCCAIVGALETLPQPAQEENE